MPHELSFVAWADGVGLYEAFGKPDDAHLEATAQLDGGTNAQGDLDAAATDVDGHCRFARDADAVNGGEMDQPRLFGSRDNPWADTCVLSYRSEELAAIVSFTDGAGCGRQNPVHTMRISQSLELRHHLKRSLHSLRRERSAVQSAGAKPDHFLFPVDHLK